MTDEGLESLAKSLQHNESLQQLNICNGFTYPLTTYSVYRCIGYLNTITEKGISVSLEPGSP